jgi:hypothetical protein
MRCARSRVYGEFSSYTCVCRSTYRQQCACVFTTSRMVQRRVEKELKSSELGSYSPVLNLGLVLNAVGLTIIKFHAFQVSCPHLFFLCLVFIMSSLASVDGLLEHLCSIHNLSFNLNKSDFVWLTYERNMPVAALSFIRSSIFSPAQVLGLADKRTSIISRRGTSLNPILLTVFLLTN